MRALFIRGGTLFVLVALWVAGPILARPAPGVVRARWVPERCSPAPTSMLRAVVTWDDLRAAGMDLSRLPEYSRRDWPASTRRRTVPAARFRRDVYLAWSLPPRRIVVSRVRLDERGTVSAIEVTSALHGEALLGMTAHAGGVTLWTRGDHGVRRAQLDRGLGVMDFSLVVARDAPRARPVRALLIPFSGEGALLEQGADGQRWISSLEETNDGALSRVPLSDHAAECVWSGDEVALLDADLAFSGGARLWRARYGDVRLAVVGGAAVTVLLLLALAWRLERRQRRLEGAFRTGTVGVAAGGGTTWLDDEAGPMRLTRVGTRVGSSAGRAVLVGELPVTPDYRRSPRLEAHALFVGSPDRFRDWLRERRATRELVFAAASLLVSFAAWGLVATAVF